MNKKRLAKIGISLELLQDMMTVGWHGEGLSCTNGLPDGAEFVRWYVRDFFPANIQTVYLVFEHESFDEMIYGEVIPDLKVEHTRKYE